MEIILIAVILLFSAILHEIVHGFVAEKLGDPTARLLGRLTLNPLPHIDPVMSVIVPILTLISFGFAFGGAKPVPVNPIHFEDPKKDMALVALAGPLTNFALAIVAALLYHVTDSFPFLQIVFQLIVFYNLLLGILNLIPLPPLDGSKVLGAVLPDEIARTYFSFENIGFFILIALFLFPIGNFNLWNVILHLMVSISSVLGIPSL